MSRPRNRLIRALVPAGIAAAVLALVSCSRETPPAPEAIRPIRLHEVGAADEAIARMFPGQIEAEQRVDLSFRVGGQLAELPINNGDRVEAGALLAKLDPRDFEIALNAARAERERTEADFQRYAALYEKEAVSKAQLDQSRAAMEVARANLDGAQAALTDSELRAPFEAMVAERLLDNFQEVTPGLPVASLVGLGLLKVDVDLPEGIIARGRAPGVEPKFVARADAFPGVDLPLEFREIALQADPRTQTFRATFTMEQPDEKNMLPGMTVNVVIRGVSGAGGDGTVVPAACVASTQGGGSHVWVVDRDAMTVSRRAVTTGGLTGRDLIEIVDGLTSGETIAASGVTHLEDGMKIRNLDG